MAYYREDTGYWEARVTVHYPDGTKDYIRRKSPRNTKRAAEAYERELREECMRKWEARRRGVSLEEAPTLELFRDEFLQWAAANVKASTVDTYRSVLDTGLVPALGDLRLDQIGPRHIERYKARKKVSAKTMRNHLGVLSKLLNVAKKYELITNVPDMEPPDPAKQSVEELEFWDFDEADRVLEAAKSEPRIENIVRLAMFTGLRMGEVCGLQWGDIDMHKGHLIVRRTYSHKRVTSPKSNRKRRVPLSQAAIDTLTSQKAETYMRARPGEPDWVFFDESGLFSYNRIKDGYWRIVKNAEVTRISFHGLRHTFASHAVMRGVPIEVLQKWLGHSDIRQTMKYAHLAPDHSDKFVELLNDVHGNSTSVARAETKKPLPRIECEGEA